MKAWSSIDKKPILLTRNNIYKHKQTATFNIFIQSQTRLSSTPDSKHESHPPCLRFGIRLAGLLLGRTRRIRTAARLGRVDVGSFTLARKIYWKNEDCVRKATDFSLGRILDSKCSSFTTTTMTGGQSVCPPRTARKQRGLVRYRTRRTEHRDVSAVTSSQNIYPDPLSTVFSSAWRAPFGSPSDSRSPCCQSPPLRSPGRELSTNNRGSRYGPQSR